MKTLLKVHEDVVTVPEAIGKMMEEYASQGYEVKRLSGMNFKIILSGGWVHIYWKDGRIWQEIMEEEEQRTVAGDEERAAGECVTKENNMTEDLNNRNDEKKLGIRFENLPKRKSFEIERKALFKPEDGIKNMAFAESLEIKVRVSAIRNEETRKELEAFVDRMMAEAQKIIAEQEIYSSWSGCKHTL